MFTLYDTNGYLFSFRFASRVVKTQELPILVGLIPTRAVVFLLAIELPDP